MISAIRTAGSRPFVASHVGLMRQTPSSRVGVRSSSDNREHVTRADLEDSVMRVKAQQLNLDKAGRHIFLCSDQSVPKCCAKDVSLEAWDYLKNRLKELGIDRNGPVWRTKANCLRVCAKGPVAVVFPGDALGRPVYYHSCTPAVLETIIQKHLINGEIVDEFRILPDSCAAVAGAK